MASASSSAERDPAPSSSMPATRLAMPNRPLRSRLLPPRMTTLTCTIGTRGRSIIQTGTPLASVVL